MGEEREEIQEEKVEEIKEKQQNKKKKMPIILKILIVLILLAIITVVGVYFWYTSSISAVDKNNTEIKVIEIENGAVATEIAKILKENNLIKDEIGFRIYCKLNKVNNLQAGTYEFSSSMNIEQITKKLQTGDILRQDITIMFPEGKNMRSIAKVIEENTNNTYDEAMTIFESKEYAEELIGKYWFLTDEILNDNIYYPLEGYLFPNTYIFENKNISIEEIVETMLKETDKVLTKYKKEIDSKEYTVHKFLSLASTVENEGMNTEDRKGIAGVFLNRIENNIALQSDVTTYYAFKIDIGDRDLTLKELNTYNKYNTRGPNMEGKIPVGPISNVSESAIEATLNPTNTDAFFFVADKNGKVYFSKTNAEHDETINKLKDQNLWYIFD